MCVCVCVCVLHILFVFYSILFYSYSICVLHIYIFYIYHAQAPLLESPSRGIAAQATATLLRCLPCSSPALLLPAVPRLVQRLGQLKADDTVSRLLLLRWGAIQG